MPNQVAVRFTDRFRVSFFHRATVVEPGTYAEQVRLATAKAERLRNPPRRAVDALAGVSGAFNRHAERLPIVGLVRSLEAAGIRLETVKGRLHPRAPEGRINAWQQQVLTRYEELIVAHLDGKPVKCFVCNKADAVTYAVPSLPVCAACLAKEV